MEQNRIPSVIPEQLASVSQAFVKFLKAYYEYMNTEDLPSYMINNAVASRDVFNSVDTYLDVIYKEFGADWVENKLGDRANIISNLNSIYKAKGSVDSIKVLFRALFGEEVTVTLPKEFILKPSTGAWSQDYSVTVKLDDGDIFKTSGQFVTVTTFFPGAPEQRFEVEIKQINIRDSAGGIYELFISRYYSGFFYAGSTLAFQDVKMTLIESLSNVVDIASAGTGFSLGETYNIPHYDYNYSFNYINGLQEPERTEYLSAVSSLYEEKIFKRWYVSADKLKPNKIESVKRQHFTNGSSVETISREDVTKLIITRGRKATTQIRGVDGSSRTSIVELPDNLPATNIRVNYDAVIEKFIDKISFSGGGNLAAFFEEVPAGENFARGDINNDGVVDISDFVILVRRAKGYTVTADEQIWVDTFIGQAILDLDLNDEFIESVGTGASVRVIGTGGDDGINLLRLVTFGYNYPQVYTSFVTPNDPNGDPAELSFISNPVGITAAEYKDRKGFLSDIIKIHDNNFYQEFSYTVQSSQNPTVSEDVITRTIHPAGMKLFAEQVIVSDFSLTGLNLNAEHHFASAVEVGDLFTSLAYELVRVSDSVAKYFHKPFSESLTIADSQAKTSRKPFEESLSVEEYAELTVVELYAESGYFEDNHDTVGFYRTPVTIT